MKVRRICKKCGTVFTTYESRTRDGKGKYCSNSCARKGKSPGNKGKPSPNRGNHEHFWERVRECEVTKNPKLAKMLVSMAIYYGFIRKTPCVVCGKLKVDAHHPDYSKPLAVVFLCRKDHRQLTEAQRRETI